MKITVLDGGVLNPGDVSWQPLAELGELKIFYDTAPWDVAGRVADSDVVLVNKVKLGKGDLDALRQCRLVGALATGVNNLDLEALAEAGIDICNVTNYGEEDVAQHALALLMEICRGVGEHAQSVRDGEWAKKDWCYWLRAPICLTGLCMGIIGFGAIGRVTGRLAHALGMEVLACSHTPKAAPDYAPFAFVTVDEIFARADVISLHCPLTPETREIINAGTIGKMRHGAIVINTARGGLVNETAVAEALKNGQLGGYGADVLSSEPPGADNPLQNAPNCFITPHMAWGTPSARQRIIDIMAANIRGWLAGDLPNRVDGRK